MKVGTAFDGGLLVAAMRVHRIFERQIARGGPQYRAGDDMKNPETNEHAGNQRLFVERHRRPRWPVVSGRKMARHLRAKIVCGHRDPPVAVEKAKSPFLDPLSSSEWMTGVGGSSSCAIRKTTFLIADHATRSPVGVPNMLG
jgi:hypothetical protein